MLCQAAVSRRRQQMVVLERAQFVVERHQPAVARREHVAVGVGERFDERHGPLVPALDQMLERVQVVEQEVRVDFTRQSVQLG